MVLKKKKVIALAMAVIGSFAILAAGCGDNSSSSQKSGNYIQTIKDRGVLKVGVKEDVPLFGFKNPQTGKLEVAEVNMTQLVERVCESMAKKYKDKESVIQFIKIHIS